MLTIFCWSRAKLTPNERRWLHVLVNWNKNYSSCASKLRDFHPTKHMWKMGWFYTSKSKSFLLNVQEVQGSSILRVHLVSIFYHIFCWGVISNSILYQSARRPTSCIANSTPFLVLRNGSLPQVWTKLFDVGNFEKYDYTAKLDIDVTRWRHDSLVNKPERWSFGLFFLQTGLSMA